MNAVLPLFSKSAPSAPPDAASQREAVEGGETFATVMDRRNPPGRQRAEGGEPHRTEGEAKDTEASGCGSAQEADKTPRLEDSDEVEEAPLPSPLPTLVLPTLPYHLAENPGFLWPSIIGEASPTDGADEGTADSLDADSFAAQKPAQNSGAIFAGPSQELPILAAMFPVSMVQLQAQLQIPQEPDARGFSLPTATGETAAARVAPASRELQAGAMHPMPAPGSHIGSVAESRGVPATPGIAVPANDLPLPAEAAPVGGQAEAYVVPADQSPTTLRQRTKELPRPMPLTTERPGIVVPQEASLESTDVQPPLNPKTVSPDPVIASRPTRRMAPESTLVDGVLPTHGTTAAKGGEVMHDVPFQAPPKPRVARASESRLAPLGSVESPQQSATAPTPEMPAIAVAPTEAQGRRTPDQRLGTAPQAETRETLSATPLPGTTTRAEAEPAHSTRQSVTAAEPAERVISEYRPGAEVQIEPSNAMPAEFQTVRPPIDRTSNEPVSADAPITRAEMVQVVERTAEAAVRMRAAGNERIEVAVQLESGDHLTIQLRIANGEVTSHFRTSSEGLRTALEQNWTQFSDRANDRGVRMTQPVFDVNQSSSNMTDLGQQRHGRDPGYTDPQAELFPNLPRRMRAPRVISATPLESASAAPAGVRTYA